MILKTPNRCPLMTLSFNFDCKLKYYTAIFTCNVLLCYHLHFFVYVAYYVLAYVLFLVFLLTMSFGLEPKKRKAIRLMKFFFWFFKLLLYHTFFLFHIFYASLVFFNRR